MVTVVAVPPRVDVVRIIATFVIVAPPLPDAVDVKLRLVQRIMLLLLIELMDGGIGPLIKFNSQSSK